MGVCGAAGRAARGVCQPGGDGRPRRGRGTITRPLAAGKTGAGPDPASRLARAEGQRLPGEPGRRRSGVRTRLGPAGFGTPGKRRSGARAGPGSPAREAHRGARRAAAVGAARGPAAGAGRCRLRLVRLAAGPPATAGARTRAGIERAHRHRPALPRAPARAWSSSAGWLAPGPWAPQRPPGSLRASPGRPRPPRRPLSRQVPVPAIPRHPGWARADRPAGPDNPALRGQPRDPRGRRPQGPRRPRGGPGPGKPALRRGGRARGSGPPACPPSPRLRAAALRRRWAHRARATARSRPGPAARTDGAGFLVGAPGSMGRRPVGTARGRQEPGRHPQPRPRRGPPPGSGSWPRSALRAPCLLGGLHLRPRPPPRPSPAAGRCAISAPMWPIPGPPGQPALQRLAEPAPDSPPWSSRGTAAPAGPARTARKRRVPPSPIVGGGGTRCAWRSG